MLVHTVLKRQLLWDWSWHQRHYKYRIRQYTCFFLFLNLYNGSLSCHWESDLRDAPLYIIYIRIINCYIRICAHFTCKCWLERGLITCKPIKHVLFSQYACPLRTQLLHQHVSSHEESESRVVHMPWSARRVVFFFSFNIAPSKVVYHKLPEQKFQVNNRLTVSSLMKSEYVHKHLHDHFQKYADLELCHLSLLSTSYNLLRRFVIQLI